MFIFESSIKINSLTKQLLKGGLENNSFDISVV
jgi:hypothetical protein